MSKNGAALEETIKRAITKIKGTSENDVCKYLPAEGGGYMHHFTLRKMKAESPQELVKMISTYILNPATPRRVPHKPRRPRGTRKRQDLIALTRGELERVLTHLRSAGDQEMAAKLSPKQSLPQVRRQLINSIRKHEVNQELWATYCELINAQAMSTDSNQPSGGRVLIAAK